MADQQWRVGIDLGGTKILAIAVDADGKIRGRAKCDTPAGAGLEAIARRMQELAGEALQSAGVTWEAVTGIGVAVPSAVDPQSGVVLHAPALGWKNLKAAEAFKTAFKRAVALDNDVNCGTLAEARLGAGRGATCMVGYFVGTGLGGGIVIGGQLHRGLRGCAGELGHETVRANGRRCGCGKRGCLEAYCSKTAFARRLNRMINRRGMKSTITEYVDDPSFKTLKSKALAKAYREGDAVVCAVVDKGVRMLGVAVANMMAVLAPDCIVLGGGVMDALGKELLSKVEEAALEHLFALQPRDLRLRLSALGDDAVALGAALLAPAPA